jgi:hypothetical protein
MVAGVTIVVDVAVDEGVVPFDEQPAKRQTAAPIDAPNAIIRLAKDTVGRLTSMDALYRSLLPDRRVRMGERPTRSTSFGDD